jgi:hypothetical protein
MVVQSSATVSEESTSAAVSTAAIPFASVIRVLREQGLGDWLPFVPRAHRWNAVKGSEEEEEEEEEEDEEELFDDASDSESDTAPEEPRRRQPVQRGEWDTSSDEDSDDDRDRDDDDSFDATRTYPVYSGKENQCSTNALSAATSPAVAPSLEALWDAEVAADDFHEARYLRPQYVMLLCDDGPLPLFGSGLRIVKQRYVFSVPTSADIYAFMKQLFSRAKLTAESIIISLVYVERLMEGNRANSSNSGANSGQGLGGLLPGSPMSAPMSLRAHNWRSIVLCGMLLASKVWDDLCSWSVEFTAIYPQYSVQAINTMERAFVARIGFNLYISGSVYARYYFALRALNEQKSFRQRYLSMLLMGTGSAAGSQQGASGAGNLGAAAGGAGMVMARPAGPLPVPVVRRIEEASKAMRASLYSRSL